MESSVLKRKLNEKGKELFERLNTYKSWLLTVKVCDPACGSGAFLNQALSYFIEEHKFVDDIIAELTNTPLRLFDTDLQILENNIFGVDINEESVEIAKLSMWLRTAQPGRKLSDLSNNIKCGNSLIDDVEVAGEKAFNWEKEFPAVFEKGGFDVVIGNPPYVRKQALMEHYPEMCAFFEKNFQAATANYDLYALFMEKCFHLINSFGEISFILPHKFLVTDFGEGIRNFLLINKGVQSIVHFGSEIVFNDASTYTCIINLNKIEKTKVLFKKISPHQLFANFTWENIPYEKLTKNNWDLQDNKVLSVINKLSRQKYKVKDKFAKIFTGLQTSADDIYFLEGEIVGNYFEGTSKACQEKFQIEKELVKPILKGQDIARYKNLSNTIFVIFPYLIEARKAKDMSEVFIENNYPKGFNYLKNFEVQLRSREKNKMNHDKWFLYIYPKSLVEFEQIKLITPYLGIKPNFTLEKGVFYHNTKGFGLLLNDPTENYLTYLAILNSSTFWFFLKNSASEFRGGYMTFTKSYIDPFPLPDITSCENLAEKAELMLSFNDNLQKLNIKYSQLINSDFGLVKIPKKLEEYFSLTWSDFEKELTKNKVTLLGVQKEDWFDRFERFKKQALELKTQIDQTDKEIDRMVYALYGLTEEEVQIVENS